MKNLIKTKEHSILCYASDVYILYPTQRHTISVFLTRELTKKTQAILKSMVKSKPNKAAKQYISWARKCRKNEL